MTLLFQNDLRGAYPNSWYAATAQELPVQPTLRGQIKTDVAIVGAGYTGLSAALHLAKTGRSVVLLDAQRIGFGASGRNGGQLGSGQRQDQEYLIKLVGQDTASHLWDLAEDAKSLVKSLIRDHKIDCYYQDGVADVTVRARETREYHAYADFLAEHYGYDKIQKLDPDALQEICPSPAYHGGILDHSAGHLHPLRYALGLGQACLDAGVSVYENTLVTGYQDDANGVTVTTEHGSVKADQTILACNGYMGELSPKVAGRVMPINNFIVATEPLGDDAKRVLTKDIAIADSNFVINYYRLSHDGRLLFGGGENYGYKFPRDIAKTVRKPMEKIYPHLKDIRIDYAWGGTLGITMRRMPYLTKLAPRVLNASGYSGHGVGTATHAGQLMAQAINGDASGFDVMSRVPATPFPGGTRARTPLLVLAMTWFALRDRLGV